MLKNLAGETSPGRMTQDPSEMSFPRLIWETFKELWKRGELAEAIRPPEQADPPGTVTPADLQALDYDQFEELIAAIYRARGYGTELTPDGADRGVDILASDSQRTIAIQAKRYAEPNRVSVRPVREIVGAAEVFGAEDAAVATSSSFTDPARETAAAVDVTLLDGDRCCKLIENSPARVRDRVDP